ncbi:MAG: hypothetical protein HKM04_04860 [Legionellales bacterium]|nr:hypothetical protein [Legionellales bacterium]
MSKIKKLDNAVEAGKGAADVLALLAGVGGLAAPPLALVALLIEAPVLGFRAGEKLAELHEKHINKKAARINAETPVEGAIANNRNMMFAKPSKALEVARTMEKVLDEAPVAGSVNRGSH